MKLLITLLLLISTGAFAQRPTRAYFPWWESPLRRSLHLTEQQQQQIRTILKQHRDEMIDERAAVEKAEADVEDLFSERTVDPAQAKQAIDRLVTARGKLSRTFIQLSLKLRQVLTDQQWEKLEQRRSAYRARRWKRPTMRRNRRPRKRMAPGRGPGPFPPSEPPAPPKPPSP